MWLSANSTVSKATLQQCYVLLIACILVLDLFTFGGRGGGGSRCLGGRVAGGGGVVK